MKKHEQFTEIQAYIGRVPRADEFIEALGDAPYRRQSDIKGVDVVEVSGAWFSYRALARGKQVLCIYLKNKGDNTPHYQAYNAIKRVLGIK